MDQFVTQLYGQENHFVTLRTLKLDKNRQMSRFTTRKRGISDIFLKFDVADDGITCFPLRKNNKIM